MSRGRRVGALAAACVCAPLAVGCERLPTAPASPFRAPVRGVTFVDWTATGYRRPEAAASLAALAATGANTAVVLVTAYQAGPNGSAVRADDPRTPTPASVREALAAARALGLRVAVKPHVDLDDGSWRGGIDPGDPEAWFRSYREFVVPLAALAESAGAVHFVVGTELAGTLRHAGRWREVVRAARSRFSGAIVYAASWDEAERVPFWGEVDLVGVDFYFPVAARRNPGRLEILSGWQPWLERLRRLSRRTGRRILLSEVGYRSVDGAGMHPYRFGTGEALDLGEQADLYWAALQATGDEPWLAGLYWWNWTADGSGGPGNPDYTPRGKPAERELRAAWGGAEVAARLTGGSQ